MTVLPVFGENWVPAFISEGLPALHKAVVKLDQFCCEIRVHASPAVLFCMRQLLDLNLSLGKIPTEKFLGFPQSPRPVAGWYLSLDRDCFLERFSQFMFTIIQSYGAVYSKTSNHI